jgi:NADH:ubiquinone reductase (H+-translocating)
VLALHHPVVNFSLRREVFFVTVGAIAGAFTMHAPWMLLDVLGASPYLITLITAARIVGSTEPLVGFLLHFFVSVVIGIVTGVFLHKVFKYNISAVPNGIVYGIIAGAIVFAVFAIPVSHLLLGPNTVETLVAFYGNMTFEEAEGLVSEGVLRKQAESFGIHIIWGITVGLVGSALTRRFGANYRCYVCKIEFSNIRTHRHHVEHVHENPSPAMRKVLILGGGYAGVNVLRRIQKRFEHDVNVSIEVVSESNFFLHTPMLPELATGTIEPRHIATPIRTFCRRARFYQARTTKVDLGSRTVTIQRDPDSELKMLTYDYLVLAVGSRTNFFGNSNIEKNALTIKSLPDATKIMNRMVSLLEDADQEPRMQKKLMTFVIVGGGFSGVETAGEINEFVRESASMFYRNIDPELIRVVLVASGKGILPEIGDLGDYAMGALRKAGVSIITGTKLVDATDDEAVLSDGTRLEYGMLVWAGGNLADDVVASLDAEHHRDGRVVVDKYLRVKGHNDVFAVGDCAYITDENGQPYPPTAQHAIREARTAANNLIEEVLGTAKMEAFSYNTKGSMAKIGRRDGVALLMGSRMTGFVAWFLWKQYYLFALPTFEKRLRVGTDWFVDLFAPRDITRI